MCDVTKVEGRLFGLLSPFDHASWVARREGPKVQKIAEGNIGIKFIVNGLWAKTQQFSKW